MNQDYNVEELYEDNVDTQDPLTLLILSEIPDMDMNQYREASKHFIRILSLAINFIITSRNPLTAAYSVAYALQLPSVNDKSMRQLSRELGISSGTLSSSAKSFRKYAGLDELSIL